MNKNIDLFKNPLGIVALVVGIAVVIGFFISINGYGSKANSEKVPTASVNKESTDSPSAPANVFKDVTISGKSNSATNKVTLPRGVYVMKGEYTGESNFIVGLQGTEPENHISVFNEIGNYKGSSSFVVEVDGTYILDVESYGSWTIEITK